MRKYVWFLVAAAFAVAIFAMVGCKPATTPAVSPSPATSPVPTADTACPKVTTSVVQKLYDADDQNSNGEFAIILTFDEEIQGNWACLLDPNNWTIVVTNDSRQSSTFKSTNLPYGGHKIPSSDITVTMLSSKKIMITAKVVETVGDKTFNGLICDEEDASLYVSKLGLSSYQAPAFADTVKWKLDPDCAIFDKLGNACCGLEGEACCSVTCEVVVPSGCPL